MFRFGIFSLRFNVVVLDHSEVLPEVADVFIFLEGLLNIPDCSTLCQIQLEFADFGEINCEFAILNVQTLYHI